VSEGKECPTSRQRRSGHRRTIWLFGLRTDSSVTDFDQVTWANRQVYVMSKTVGAAGVPGSHIRRAGATNLNWILNGRTEP
jgi:hypothetical protein